MSQVERCASRETLKVKTLLRTVFLVLSTLGIPALLVLDDAQADVLITLPDNFYQQDEQWGFLCLGNSNSQSQDCAYFDHYGCVVTGAAMLLRYYGITNVHVIPSVPNDIAVTLNPGTLNKWLADPARGWDEGPLSYFRWDKDHRRNTLLSWRDIADFSYSIRHFNGGQYLVTASDPGHTCGCCPHCGSEPSCLENFLVQQLEEYYPQPVRVTSKGECGAHTYLVVGRGPLGWWVENPGDSRIEDLRPTSWKWDRWDYVRPADSIPVRPGGQNPNGNWLQQTSEYPRRVSVYLHGDVRVTLFAPDGSRLGTDPDGTEVREIVGGDFALIPGLTNDSPDLPSLQLESEVEYDIYDPAPGMWDIEVYGSPADSFAIDFQFIDDTGSFRRSRYQDVIPTEGSVMVYHESVGTLLSSSDYVNGDMICLLDVVAVPSLDGTKITVYAADLEDRIVATVPQGDEAHPVPVEAGTPVNMYGRVFVEGDSVYVETSRFVTLPRAQAANALPRAVADRFTAESTVPLMIPSSALLANDVDEDDDELVLFAVTADVDTRGTVSLQGDQVVFEAEAGFQGLTSFH
ncbi:MAG: Ig-like domain-containing protein [Candidatus Eisenbacteria bacterium]